MPPLTYTIALGLLVPGGAQLHQQRPTGLLYLAAGIVHATIGTEKFGPAILAVVPLLALLDALLAPPRRSAGAA